MRRSASLWRPAAAATQRGAAHGDGDLVYVRNAAAPGTAPGTVGRDFGERVEITAGLKATETVAGTAAFLLDSEAQLRGVPRPVGGSDE